MLPTGRHIPPGLAMLSPKKLRIWLDISPIKAFLYRMPEQRACAAVRRPTIRVYAVLFSRPLFNTFHELR